MAVREFLPVSKWFLELTLRAKQITPWNTVPDNSVNNCVHFCLQPHVLWEDVHGKSPLYVMTPHKMVQNLYDVNSRSTVRAV